MHHHVIRQNSEYIEYSENLTLSDINPDSPICSVPPAWSLFISRSSHFARFSSSLRGMRMPFDSISRNRMGERAAVDEAGEEYEPEPSWLGE